MNCVEYTIKSDDLIFDLNGKITLVNWVWRVVIHYHKPFMLHDMYPVRIIFIAVKMFVHHISAVNRDAVFTGIASHGNGNFFLHFEYSGIIIVYKNMTIRVGHQNPPVFISLPLIKNL